MSENILESVKDNLGINEADNAFDTDIKLHINMAFSTLFQLGVGKENPFQLDEEGSEWESMFSDYIDILSFIKEYTYLKVRLLFDPPTNTSVMDAYTKQANEVEYRIVIQLEGAFEEGE